MWLLITLSCMATPLALCAFIAEDYSSLTATTEWCDLRGALVGVAWRGKGCVRKMSWFNYGLMHVALLVWIVGLLAAHAHYLAPFEDPFAATRDEGDGGERASAEADAAALAEADGAADDEEPADAGGAAPADGRDGQAAAPQPLYDDGATGADDDGHRLTAQVPHVLGRPHEED